MPYWDIFLFSLEIYIVVDISADKRDVQTKNLAKIEFSRRGAWPTALKFLGSTQHLWSLISHPGLFGVRIQRTEIFRRNGRNHAHFSKSRPKRIDVLAHIITSSTARDLDIDVTIFEPQRLWLAINGHNFGLPLLCSNTSQQRKLITSAVQHF